jgi:hypothetical protein
MLACGGGGGLLVGEESDDDAGGFVGQVRESESPKQLAFT